MKAPKTLVLAFLCAAPAWAAPTIHSTDYHPNPAFVPIFKRALGPVGRVEQVGEVVIVEGDDQLVSSDGMGHFGIDANANNPPNITSRVIASYGDVFDEVIIFTTFDDNGAAGALAYEMSTQQDIAGIGQDQFDDSASWGSDNGHLHAFVNMMLWNQFDGDVPMTDPDSELYSTLGQEFAHRWLSFFHYKDATGADSAAMLGRDAAHWGSNLQADGSVMDGNTIVDNGDGTFTITEIMVRYSRLDLYGMGLVGPEAVKPFFLVRNPVTVAGKKVDPTRYLSVGVKLTGQREDITMDQVLAASGARDPAMADSPHDFRVAFALVTRPGERADDVRDIAAQLEIVRHVWEQQFVSFADGHGTMCTQVSAPCDAPTAKIVGGEVTEAGGNHNHVAEPGEPVWVSFTVANDGHSDAKDVSVTALAPVVTDPRPVVLGTLARRTEQDALFLGAIPKDAPCGTPITVQGESSVGGNTFRGFIEVTPGLTAAIKGAVDGNDGGFQVVADDNPPQNGWQWGTPVEYSGSGGWLYQPGAGHGSSRAWFTGLAAGHGPMTDSSLGAGTTRLISQPIVFTNLYKPRLTYYAWFQAVEFSSDQTGQVVPGLALVVEGTTDGINWVTVDRVDGAEPNWRARDVTLDDKLKPGPRLKLRFTVANPSAGPLVEAGISDVSVVALTEACNPNPPVVAPKKAAAGCALAGGAGTPAAPLLLVAGLLLLVGYRRRPASEEQAPIAAAAERARSGRAA
jgi:hypothetical protein